MLVSASFFLVNRVWPAPQRLWLPSLVTLPFSPLSTFPFPMIFEILPTACILSVGFEISTERSSVIKVCLYVAVWWPWVEDELPEYNREMALILMSTLEHHGTCCKHDSVMKK